MIIALIGNDGSGKTTIAKKLVKFFNDLDYDVDYEHEYEYGILKFFLRILGKDRLSKSKLEFLDIKIKRKRYYVWPFLVWFDRFIQHYYYRLFKKKSIMILDRYAYDHYMSFRYSGYMIRVAKFLYLNFPKPDVCINLWVDPNVALERKKDTHMFKLEFYKSQTEEYSKLSQLLAIPRINTQKPIESTLEEIVRIIIKKAYETQNPMIAKIASKKFPTNAIEKVSIIIPTFNRDEKLKRLLESLYREIKNTKRKIEVFVVDDAVRSETKDLTNIFKNKFSENSISLMYLNSEGNQYPSSCRNLGAKLTTGQLLIFIDDDNELSGNVIETISKFMEDHPFVGMSGITTYTPDGKLWCIGGRISKNPFTVFAGNIREGINERIKIVDFTPNLYAVRKDVFKKVEGFDTKNFPMAFEEGDLSLRIWQKGFIICVQNEKNVYTTHLTIDFKDRPMRPERYYIRGKSRILFYNKYHKRLLLWKGIPDILFRTIITLRYKIPFQTKRKLISEYMRGMRDAFQMIDNE